MQNMQPQQDHKQSIATDGFTITNNVFTNQEIDAITAAIAAANTTTPFFRQTGDLFAIRRFLHEVPGVVPHVFNEKLIATITNLFGQDYFVVKSIYFDKPGSSNWFVAWHQDLTIAVDNKHEVDGFCNWTKKQGQFAVQPPAEMLADNFTIRIHLDDTDENNGALKVIPGSHAKGICRPDKIGAGKENTCTVKKGGIMIMRPLLMHASGRTGNNKSRRVVHIEFSNSQLPQPLQWSEAMQIKEAPKKLTTLYPG